MKTLKTKSEISAKNLKSQTCDFKGMKLSFDKEQKLYTVGSHFNSGVRYFDSISDLKAAL